MVIPHISVTRYPPAEQILQGHNCQWDSQSVDDSTNAITRVHYEYATPLGKVHCHLKHCHESVTTVMTLISKPVWSHAQAQLLLITESHNQCSLINGSLYSASGFTRWLVAGMVMNSWVCLEPILSININSLVYCFMIIQKVARQIMGIFSIFCCFKWRCFKRM